MAEYNNQKIFMTLIFLQDKASMSKLEADLLPPPAQSCCHSTVIELSWRAF